MCLLVTFVSPAETAELIQMPIGRWPRVGPRNHVLDGVEIPHGRAELGLLWAIEKHWVSVYGTLHSKKSIKVTAGLQQLRAVFQTGHCHIT